MGGLKESGQAVGAEVLTRLAGFAAPTVLDQASRLQTRQRFFNLVVTNVPGPQFPLYLEGRRLRAFYPQVPLTLNTALGIAIMSYDGRLGFGLLGDYDAMPDLEQVAGDLERSIDELAEAAGIQEKPAPSAAAPPHAGRPPRRSAAAGRPPARHRAGGRRHLRAAAGLQRARRRRRRRPAAPRGPGSCSPTSARGTSRPASTCPLDGPHRPADQRRPPRPAADARGPAEPGRDPARARARRRDPLLRRRAPAGRAAGAPARRQRTVRRRGRRRRPAGHPRPQRRRRSGDRRRLAAAAPRRRPVRPAAARVRRGLDRPRRRG